MLEPPFQMLVRKDFWADLPWEGEGGSLAPRSLEEGGGSGREAPGGVDRGEGGCRGASRAVVPGGDETSSPPLDPRVVDKTPNPGAADRRAE